MAPPSPAKANPPTPMPIVSTPNAAIRFITFRPRVIRGRAKAQQCIRAELYYLYLASTEYVATARSSACVINPRTKVMSWPLTFADGRINCDRRITPHRNLSAGFLFCKRFCSSNAICHYIESNNSTNRRTRLSPRLQLRIACAQRQGRQAQFDASASRLRTCGPTSKRSGFSNGHNIGMYLEICSRYTKSLLWRLKLSRIKESGRPKRGPH
jgi:hypothetical protein